MNEENIYTKERYETIGTLEKEIVSLIKEKFPRPLIVADLNNLLRDVQGEFAEIPLMID